MRINPTRLASNLILNISDGRKCHTILFVNGR